jgi:hypothetical protein
MAAALDIHISWLSEFDAPVFSFFPSSSKPIHFPFKKHFHLLCRHRRTAEKVSCQFHIKYFIRERSLAQKNVFTGHLFSSFVNNELESKCFY